MKLEFNDTIISFLFGFVRVLLIKHDFDLIMLTL